MKVYWAYTWVAVLILACLLTIGSNCYVMASTTGEMETFKSAGHTIRMEIFRPVADGKKHPVVLLVHGSGGIEPSGGFFRDMAIQLSKRGVIAVVLHYMDRNGMKWANNPQMAVHFQEWMKTIQDAIGYVQKLADVDAQRISLFGHSLGAQLSLHVAAVDNRVHSVIDMAGCFVLATDKISRMPPVLVLQGSADKVVTLKREGKMIAVLKRTKAPYEENIFPGVDHMFSGVSQEKLLEKITPFLQQ